MLDYSQFPDNSVIADTMSQEDARELLKALEAGSITGRETANSTTASGAPLKVESLEKQLKVVTFEQQDIRLWKNIPKKAAYNTVEEYNQLSSYGSDFAGGFNLEGELPDEESSVYIRRSQLVKFLGVTKAVTHPLSLVRTQIADIMDRENKNGTQFILRKLDRALTNGDDTQIPQEFNGIYTQQQTSGFFPTLNSYFNSEVVIDLRGGPLLETHIEDAANGIIENFGLADAFFAPPRVLSDFIKTFYGNKFIQPGAGGTVNGIMGQRVQTFASQFGDISLDWDNFMAGRPNRTTTSAATSTKAPNAPTAGSVTPVAATVADSKWGTTDAGSYFYAVTAVNRYGESVLTVLNVAAAAIVANGAADLTWTDTPSANPTSSFVIYRSNKGATSAAAATFYPLFSVNLSQLATGYDGGAATVVRDNNRLMPNTQQAFLIQNSSEVWEFGQLAPLMKMDLAVLGPAYRWMVLLYGTPFLYAPKKMTRFINIGRA